MRSTLTIKILQHQLMSVSLSLAKTRGFLHSANKFSLAGVLTQDVATPTTVSLDGPSSLLIDAQALLKALAKPPNTKTSEDYARTFANTVYKMGATIIWIGVTFDCHRSESIKEGRKVIVRKVIDQSDDRWKKNWSLFRLIDLIS